MALSLSLSAAGNAADAGSGAACQRSGGTASGELVCAVDPTALEARAGSLHLLPAAGQLASPAQDVACDQGKLNTDRTTSCFADYEGIVLRDLETGEQTGDALFYVTSYAALNPKSRTWTQNMQIQVYLTEGTADAGSEAGVTASCKTGCRANYSPEEFLGPRTVPGSPIPTETFSYEVTSPGSAIEYPDVTPVVSVYPITPTVNSPVQIPVGPAADPSPAVRCDSQTGPTVVNMQVQRAIAPTPGCVYYKYVPTYDVSTTNAAVDQVAWHIDWAQNNLVGKPGLEGKGQPLTRLLFDSDINSNRYYACRGAPKPRPKNQQCDEYPFATSYQGAMFQQNNYSCQMVPAPENTTEGNIRGQWYATNRMGNGDAFWVHVILPPGSSAQSPEAAPADVVTCPPYVPPSPR